MFIFRALLLNTVSFLDKNRKSYAFRSESKTRLPIEQVEFHSSELCCEEICRLYFLILNAMLCCCRCAASQWSVSCSATYAPSVFPMLLLCCRGPLPCPGQCLQAVFCPWCVLSNNQQSKFLIHSLLYMVIFYFNYLCSVKCTCFVFISSVFKDPFYKRKALLRCIKFYIS